MANLKFDKDITPLLVIDPYNTTRRGSTSRLSRRRAGCIRPSKTAPEVARSAVTSNLNRVTFWRSSIGVPAALPTRIWTCSSKSTASTSSSSSGS